MADFLWQKGQTVTDEQVMAFLAGEDVRLDRLLLPFDIRASLAHAEGLRRAGILTAAELAEIKDGLDALRTAFDAGEFVLDERFEDGHSAIEFFLTRRLGETGKKIHTGRSRNDQVLVATRLYLVDAVGRLATMCREIAAAALARAEQGPDLPMPGYTHLQHAMVSSTGHWFAGQAEAFIDNAGLAVATREWLSCNPLGTAAGFGINLPLDREFTTRVLEFGRMQVNPLYAQNSRGKFEFQALSAFFQATQDLRRMAWDLSLFMMPESGFVRLPDRFTTGSSIMPNKRNPDLVEVLRGLPAIVQGAMSELQGLMSLPGGYHRDLQLTKAPVLRAVEQALAGLRFAPELIGTVDFDGERMATMIEPEMYATDRAIDLVRQGVAFRDAYRQALDDREDLASRSPEASLAARVSPGAPGNLLLDTLKARLADLGAKGGGHGAEAGGD